jgi:hypothetical protein
MDRERLLSWVAIAMGIVVVSYFFYVLYVIFG